MVSQFSEANAQSLSPGDLQTVANCLITAKTWLQKAQAVAGTEATLANDIQSAVESCRAGLLSVDSQIAKARKSL